jgi:hypothetical protein
MNIPGFTAESSLYQTSSQYQLSTRPSNNQRVIAQTRATCAFKAGRLAGRCLQLGYDHGDCMETAADFNEFCNAYDL